MKKQDTEESATQGGEDAPPTAGGTESPAAAKDSLDSNSPKESEPQTPQTDTPPQSDEAGSEGKVQSTMTDITVWYYYILKNVHQIAFIKLPFWCGT